MCSKSAVIIHWGAMLNFLLGQIKPRLQGYFQPMSIKQSQK